MSNYRCPRCTGNPPLEETELKGIEVCVCQTCRSILMTRSDLESIVTDIARRATWDPKRKPAGYFDRLKSAAEFVGKQRSIQCPHCRYNMYEVHSQNIVVDFCLNCQAIWFDEGELNSTLAIARERGAFDLIPEDLGKNETAKLICYMLDTVSEPPE